MTTREAVQQLLAHRLWLRWMCDRGLFSEWGLRAADGSPLPDPDVNDRRWRRLAAGCTAAVARARHEGTDEP